LDFAGGLEAVDLEQVLADFLLLVFPCGPPELLPFDQDAGEDLAPAPRGGAEVNNAGDASEKVEFWG
jgi:hypothetical protein